MINKVKGFMEVLSEEVKYHDNLTSHTQGLEATLWGLEEQCGHPENDSFKDKTSLSEEINQCRLKISSCKKLSTSHVTKILMMIKSFNSQNLEEESCGTCPSQKNV